ncbi:hypothetical protein [Aeromicrobium sp. UC242_57]|uniref:hypothetical protein n=1 Tax=Aeromicrobium sp. UC242_57 TaxID=3374624 RepID=UPI00379D294E
MSQPTLRQSAGRFVRGLSTIWLLLLVFAVWELYARLNPSVFFPRSARSSTTTARSGSRPIPASCSTPTCSSSRLAPA